MRISGPQAPEQEGPENHQPNSCSSQRRNMVSREVMLFAQCLTAHEWQSHFKYFLHYSTSLKDQVKL